MDMHLEFECGTSSKNQSKNQNQRNRKFQKKSAAFFFPGLLEKRNKIDDSHFGLMYRIYILLGSYLIQ